jgi:hypothetical protein
MKKLLLLIPLLFTGCVYYVQPQPIVYVIETLPPVIVTAQPKQIMETPVVTENKTIEVQKIIDSQWDYKTSYIPEERSHANSRPEQPLPYNDGWYSFPDSSSTSNGYSADTRDSYEAWFNAVTK